LVIEAKNILLAPVLDTLSVPLMNWCYVKISSLLHSLCVGSQVQWFVVSTLFQRFSFMHIARATTLQGVMA